MPDVSREFFRRVDAIFDAALDLDSSERAEFVAQASLGDTALGDRLRALLDAHERSEGFMKSPAVELAATLLEDVPSPDAPEQAGPFRIVRELGHGGMGVVYLAERVGAEFTQRVALKLVRHLGRGEALRRRFLEERRILALLEHPGIARLIDGGLTNEGLPYFAMELVEGNPIDAHCEAQQLSIAQRLDLFAEVCDAVQYAHEHLVVHRDLKPSNILVRADGQLKLLDFGIAKLLDPLRAAGDEPATQTGVIAMTPEYAAPEQVRGEPVSTATDTYALGVLLYVLLTGRRPYDVRGHTAAEVERIVCESAPPRPSTVAPEKLQRKLRGDLDLIVMKALHKDPARRYSSAAALRDDLQRFRTGLPIQARPDSAAYRLAKFSRRNRAAVAATLVTLTALLGATAFSAAQAREAQRQRDSALQEVERQSAMVEMQSVLASDSRGADGRELSASERIGLAEQVLAQQFRGKPHLVADLMTQLSGQLYEIGDREGQRALLLRARTIARDAGAPAQLARIDCARAHSLAYDDQTDSARAALVEAAGAMQRPEAQTDDISSVCLDAQGRVLMAESHPDSAVAVFKRALAFTGAGRVGTSRLQVLTGLAEALRATGRTREGTQHLRQVMIELDSMGFRGTSILPNAMTMLVGPLSELGELAAVDSVVGAALQAQTRVPGQHASQMLNFLFGLNKLRLGELDSAEVWISRSMRDTTEGAGGLSAYLPPALTQLRLEQGRIAEARAMLAKLPTGTFIRRANRAWLTAWVRRGEGAGRAASVMLEDSVRAMIGDSAKPPPALAMPLVFLAEWRLEAGDARAADSLALLARTAAAVDSLAFARSAYVGRAELVRARAQLALGSVSESRRAADRAVVALATGYGAANRRTIEAQSFRNSIPR